MTFAQLVNQILGVINTIVVPFIAALAFLVFVYGVIKYFFFENKGDEKQFSEGGQFVLWGILGLVVLFSVWGFVNILLSTLFPTLGH
jgi:uncharacterized membrane-anchored protein